MAAGRAGPPWERHDPAAELELVYRARIEHVVPVTQPLVLVSQVQRSGGTLLSQLFDGHPQCHAHPSEIHIGHPTKADWPRLDLARPETWFGMLYERPAGRQAERGYRKSKRGSDVDVLPFLFSPRLQHRLFDACVRGTEVTRARDVLDCYFTSYFNAWLDNQGLFSGPKRVVTGFTPRLAFEPANVDEFLAAYPDGTLISIVRRPDAWYASARAHKREYRDVGDAMQLWRRSVESALDARERHAERVVVLTYEQLVLETEATMRSLAERIGIAMSDELLMPTFNRMPIRANSSRPLEGYGVVRARAEAYREEFDADTSARVAELAGDLYDRASTAAL